MEMTQPNAVTSSNIEEPLVKKELNSLIDKNSNRIEFIPVDRPSEFWSDFKFIKLDNKKLKNFVFCNLCSRVFCFDPNSTGAHSRHSNACRSKSSKTQNSNNTKSVKNYLSNNLPKRARDEIVKKTTLATALDLKPFSFARGIGYLNLVQSIIDLVASHGRFEIKKYSPYGSTVSRNLDKLQSNINDKLSKLLDDLEFATAIIDHWTNRYNKTNFLGMAVLYVTNCY